MLFSMKFAPLIPELSVSNLERSLDFYNHLLGFQIDYERTEARFVFLSLGEAQIMLEEKNGHWVTGDLEYPYGRGLNFQINVPSIALLETRIEASGLGYFRAPKETSYQIGAESLCQREFLILDPDGYLLRFAEQRA